MTTLSDENVFHIKSMVKNVKVKKSAFIENALGMQCLCLVSHNNFIILIYNNFDVRVPCDKNSIKTVGWFRNANKIIQDVNFDPSGSMLLVLCRVFFVFDQYLFYLFLNAFRL